MSYRIPSIRTARVEFAGLSPAPAGGGDCDAVPPKPRRYVTRRLLPRVDGRVCICGQCVPPETGKAGRPKDYCGTNVGLFVEQTEGPDKGRKLWTPGAGGKDGKDACREFMAALAILEKYGDVVAQGATGAGWLGIRSRLFAVSNARTWNKGLRVPKPKAPAPVEEPVLVIPERVKVLA